MKASTAIKEVAENLEGSRYVHDPDPTRYGIIQKEYDRYRAANGLTLKSVNDIAPDEVIAIYDKYYWRPLKAAQLPNGVDFVIFQMGVNIGTGTAALILQRALNVPDDSIIGPATIAAANAAPRLQLIDSLLQRQDIYYDELLKKNSTRNGKYILGWHNRVEQVREFLKKRESDPGDPAQGLKNESGGLFGGLTLIILLAGLALIILIFSGRSK
jgi:lysozyme family protein